PIVGILVRRGIVDACKMEGFAPLDAGAAAAAMARATPVAGPRFGKRYTEPRALAHDVGLARAQERRCKGNWRQAVERGALNRGEGLDEPWPTIGKPMSVISTTSWATPRRAAHARANSSSFPLWR